MGLGLPGDECALAHADLDLDGVVIAEQLTKVQRTGHFLDIQADRLNNQLALALHRAAKCTELPSDIMSPPHLPSPKAISAGISSANPLLAEMP